MKSKLLEYNKININYNTITYIFNYVKKMTNGMTLKQRNNFFLWLTMILFVDDFWIICAFIFININYKYIYRKLSIPYFFFFFHSISFFQSYSIKFDDHSRSTSMIALAS